MKRIRSFILVCQFDRTEKNQRCFVCLFIYSCRLRFLISEEVLHVIIAFVVVVVAAAATGNFSYE